MAEVVLENVSKVFPGGVEAVKDVSLHIHDREFLVLVGPSGCGKSTSLRMVAGLEEATEGTIKIGERVVNDVPPKDRDIAMVFQNYALYPHMTVYKNMAFGLKLRKYPKDEIDDRVREAARILGLSDLLDRKPKALSGGQRQRVAVGRAIVRKPAVFLFDEPLSNLDAKLRVEMRAEIKRLHHRLQTTMIYVTHDQIEAMTLGDTIVVMKDGVIQQQDPPLTVYDHPENIFVAGFIGTPPMNFMTGRIIRDGSSLIFSEGAARITLTERLAQRAESYIDREIVLGVRPEDITNTAYAEPRSSGSTLETTVSVVEPLGDEMIVYLATKDSEFISKADAHETVSVGNSITVSLDLEKCHLFDKETGSNVSKER